MTGHQPALPGLEPGEVLGQLTVYDVAPPAPARVGCPPNLRRKHCPDHWDTGDGAAREHYCCRPPDHPGPHMCTCGARPICRSAWGSCAPIQHCTLSKGHDGMHRDGRGEEFDGSGRWPGSFRPWGGQ